MAKYYLIGENEDVPLDAETDSALQQAKDYADRMGYKLVTEAEYQRLTGYPSMERRAHGKEIATLASSYAENPKANIQKMIDAGYYKPETEESILRFASSIGAPSLTEAMDKDQSVIKKLYGASLDVGSGVLSAVAGPVAGRILAAKGFGALARHAGSLGADVASGAIAGGTQGGFQSGKAFDPNTAMQAGALVGGVGSAGAAIKGLGKGGFRALSSELSGVSQEALDAYAKGGAGRQAILNAKPASEIGDEIISDLNNMDDLIPESKLVKTALEGKIIAKKDIEDAIDNQMYKLIGEKGFVSPEEYPVFKKLSEWSDSLKNSSDMIPANEARKIRSQLDQLAKYGTPDIGQSASALMKKSFKDVAGKLRKNLEEVGGNEYKTIMESWAKKISAKNDLIDYLGTNPRTREKAIESKIDNLYGRNKTEQRKIFNKFDEIFGKGYSEQLKNSAYAKKLGIDLSPLTPMNERSPAWSSQYTTGKSNVGLGIAALGSGIGGLGVSPVLSPIAPVALSAWSPKASTTILSEMYNPSKVTSVAQGVARQSKTASKGYAVQEEKKKKNKNSQYGK